MNFIPNSKKVIDTLIFQQIGLYSSSSNWLIGTKTSIKLWSIKKVYFQRKEKYENGCWHLVQKFFQKNRAVGRSQILIGLNDMVGLQTPLTIMILKYWWGCSISASTIPTALKTNKKTKAKYFRYTQKGATFHTTIPRTKNLRKISKFLSTSLKKWRLMSLGFCDGFNQKSWLTSDRSIKVDQPFI